MLGRRLYFGQLNSEGWSNLSEVERYRGASAIASEVVLSELLEPYPDLPVTIDLRDRDLNVSARKAERARAIAERVLVFPQVGGPAVAVSGPSFLRFRTPDIRRSPVFPHW